MEGIFFLLRKTFGRTGFHISNFLFSLCVVVCLTDNLHKILSSYSPLLLVFRIARASIKRALTLTALFFAELCQKAKIPNGVINIITGDGSTGEYLVKHQLINKIAFTGSTEVGKKLSLRLLVQIKN